jgi:hypothetical protein
MSLEKTVYKLTLGSMSVSCEFRPVCEILSGDGPITVSFSHFSRTAYFDMRLMQNSPRSTSQRHSKNKLLAELLFVIIAA